MLRIVKRYLVSVSMPIEAASESDAAQEFWRYVAELGPNNLPVFVSPVEDELAMQTYVDGEPAGQDPEEDE
jgi:hypothetical protein